MKNTCILTALFCLSRVFSFGQEVLISLTIPQPYSPYLYEYQSFVNQQLITLTNTTANELQLKITGYIEGDNGLSAQSNASYMPSNPVVLMPFSTQVITSNTGSLDYFDQQNITYSGNQAQINKVIQTGILPQGAYTYCVEARDYFTGSILSPEAPSGCQYMYIEHLNPPVLNFPFCGDTVYANLNPLPQFVWMPVSGFSPGSSIVYDLYVSEVFPGQDPSDAIRAAMDYGAGNPVVITDIPMPTYTWLPSDQLLEPNTRYVYAVRARDVMNVVPIANNGESDICTFYWSVPESTIPFSRSPNPVFNIGIFNALFFPITTISGRIHYQFKNDVNIIDVETMTVFANSAGTGNPIPNLSLGNNISNLQFSNIGMGAAPISNEGGNQPLTFAGMQPQSVFQSGVDAMPAFMFANAVPDIKSYPLKQITIEAYSVFLTGKTANPAHPSELIELPGAPKAISIAAYTDELQHALPNQVFYVPQSEAYNYQFMDNITPVGMLGTAVTSQDGSFSLTMQQNVMCGALVAAQHELLIQLHGAAPITGYGLYRAIRLRVVSPYYCSPDLVLFPQPGGQLDIGTEISYVNSYDLKVKVVADQAASQILPTGAPIPGTVVRVGRLESQVLSIPGFVPLQECEREKFGQYHKVNGGTGEQTNYMLMNEVETSSEGEGMLRRMLRHGSDPAMHYYIEALTDPYKGMYSYTGKGKVMTLVDLNSPGSWLSSLTSDNWTTPWGSNKATSQNKPVYIRNSEFELKTYNITIKLKPALPEIYLQTLSIGSAENPLEEPLPNVSVTLSSTLNNGNTNISQFLTDDQGFLKIKMLFPEYHSQTGAVNGPSRKLTLFKWGYHIVELGGPSGKILKMGERWNAGKILLDPMGKISGTVINEDGEPVMSLVKAGEGPYVPTELKMTLNPSTLVASEIASFSILAQAGPQVPILIQPLSDEYFPHTYMKNLEVIQSGASQNLGEFKVYKKLHRAVIEVLHPGAIEYNPVTQQMGSVNQHLEGAEVILGNLPKAVTNSEGKAGFIFASPASEFRLRIKGGNAYSPVDTYLTIPISETRQTYTFVLEPGLTLSGKVTDKDTGLPIAGARVHAAIGNNDYGPFDVEAFSDDEGNYTLYGIKVESQYTTKLMVHCTKTAGDVTYVGASQEVTFSTAQNTAQFQLTKAPFDMQTIWNFPVAITHITQSQGQYYVSGDLKGISANSRFAPDGEALDFHFDNVPVSLSANGNALPVAEPQSSQIPTTRHKFRALLNNAFLVNIQKQPVPLQVLSGGDIQSGNSTQGIVVKKDEQGYGYISGFGETSLEFFNFSYSYNGKFYLGDQSGLIPIKVFSADANSSFPIRYALMNINTMNGQAKDIAFQVHEFPATAPRDKSFLRNDTVQLYTDLKLNLPLGSPNVKVHAGYIKVLQNQVLFNHLGDSLTLHLESWKLHCPSWSYDPNLGGLSANNAELKTQTINLTLPKVVIRPEELLLMQPGNLTNTGLSLSGIAPVNLHSGAQFNFQYMQATPHDQQPHWMVKIFHPSGSNAAYLKNLPALNKDVQILNVYNYSDGENDLKLPANFKVKYHNILDQTLENIFVYSDGFSLAGTVNPGIPGALEGVTGAFMYQKKQGEIEMRVEVLDIDVDATGYLHFDGDQEYISIQLGPDSLHILGTLDISDEMGSPPIKLRSKLSKTTQQIRMNIIDVAQDGKAEGTNSQFINMQDGTGKQRVLNGTMKTSGQSWNPLKYEVEFEGFGNSLSDANPSRMKFVVDGAIHNDDSENQGNFHLKNIDTPFGNFKVGFDLATSEITGNLQMQNIPLGAMHISNGTAEMRMGGAGFYMAAHTMGIYPGIGNLTSNFIVGTYPVLRPETKNLLLKNMHVKQLPGFLNSDGIQGLYVAANKTLFDVDYGIGLGVYSANIYAEAGIDAQFWLNFSGNYGASQIGGMAYADIENYMNVFQVCELCLGMGAKLGVNVAYTWNPESNFEINSCGALNAYANFCGITMNESLGLNIQWSTANGCDVEVVHGSCSPSSQQSSPGTNATGCTNK